MDTPPPNPDEPFDRNMPYAIGSDVLPGFSKLIEEMGEVGQVVGKIMGLGHMGRHWDGQDLKEALEKEIADLIGAVDFVIANNKLDATYIDDRSHVKLQRFEQWHSNIQAGKLPNDGVY